MDGDTDMDLEPQWQPIEQLPLIASLIDLLVADSAAQLTLLREAPAHPYSLDDALIDRIMTLCRAQQEDAALFAEQLRRWKGERLSDAQRREVNRLEQEIPRAVESLRASLALEALVCALAVERLREKSDFDIGLELLMRDTKPSRDEH